MVASDASSGLPVPGTPCRKITECLREVVFTGSEIRYITPMTIETRTFGCRLNTLETQFIRQAAREAGLNDTLVVNTCAVTAEAVRQARQGIRKARREAPRRRIVVTGCAVQTAPQEFAAMPQVDAVIGNREKTRSSAYAAIGAEGTKIQVGDIMRQPPAPPRVLAHMKERVRAFVQIQNGCDHRCTFCIIPFGRGPSRSLAADAIVDQCKRLVDHGHAEIVLTGVDITAYGADLDTKLRLGDLVGRILDQVPALQRLRLTSLDCAEIDTALIGLIAQEDRLMPHLHLSLQAGDDMVLKRMKRRHCRAQAIEFCARMRELRPGIVFGADMIAGFPTETDAMFENTLSIVHECGLTYLHVFPYSARAGTPAARMPQVAHEVIRRRARRLRDQAAQALERHLDTCIGKTRKVLIERDGRGHTEHHTRAIIAGTPAGALVRANITGHDGTSLHAHPA